MKTLIVIGLAAALTGCANQPPAYVSPATPCDGASRLINSPSATLAQQAIAIEYAKRHCLGPSQVQRVQIVP